MLPLTSLLICLTVTDAVRWSPEFPSGWRSLLAAVAGSAAGAALVASLGAGRTTCLAWGVATTVTSASWAFCDTTRTTQAPSGTGCRAAVSTLVVLSLWTIVAIALSDHDVPVGGSALRWYHQLAVPRLHELPPEQTLAAVSTLGFLLWPANRIVRALLTLTGFSNATGAAPLRGGRLLGPLERLFIFALALSGELTGAAAVIAAKSIVRLPELRRSRRAKEQSDDVAEYFLIGTFSSWVLALALTGYVLLFG